MMQIRDLMSIPAMQHSRIVAGRAGLNRTVHSVNMMDAPDIMDFLKPNELLLTTAYAMKDQPELLEALVRQMAESGCAGLAVKTRRFLEEIPQRAIETANAYGFPLLELSLDFSLGEVLNQALSRILQSRNDELSYALETHHAFFHLILNGEGLQEIVDKLSQLIEAPVAVLSPKLELLTFSSANKPDFSAVNRLLASWPGPKSGLTAGLRPVPGEAASDDALHAFVQPIPTTQRQGYIVALFRGAETKTMHSLALEQAANVLGFELLKAQAVKDRARRFKAEFFAELIQGEIASEQEMIHRGKQYGLQPWESMICIVCGKDAERAAEAASQDSLAEERKARETDHLYHVLKREYARLNAPFVLFTLKNKFICLMSAREWLGQETEGKHRLAQWLLALSERLLAEDDASLSFGISAPITKLADIPSAYKQASDALRFGIGHNKQRFVQFYHTKEFTDLLKLIPIDDLNEFVEDTFESWSGIEENEQREWRRTLRVFYDNHCHIGETAKQLYIHRNTVLYRLNRIEQLTGAQVRNTADSLRIRMALMIKELID